jgi:hypothetical protein
MEDDELYSSTRLAEADGRFINRLVRLRSRQPGLTVDNRACARYIKQQVKPS